MIISLRRHTDDTLDHVSRNAAQYPLTKSKNTQQVLQSQLYNSLATTKGSSDLKILDAAM